MALKPVSIQDVLKKKTPKRRLKSLEGVDIEALVSKRVKEELAKTQEETARTSKWKQKAEEIRAEEDPYKKLAKEQSAAKSFFIGAGKGLTDVGRGVGRIFGGDYSKEIEEERGGYKALQEQRPISTTLGEIAGETAPFVPVTMGLGSLAAGGKLGTTAGRVAATRGGQIGLSALAGGTETGLTALGKGKSPWQTTMEGGTGAAAAGAVEAALPTVGKAISKTGRAIKRAFGKGTVLKGKTGDVGKEFQEAMKEFGMTPNDLTTTQMDELATIDDLSDPKEVARFAFLSKQGFTDKAAPTRANITRTADDWQTQQELMKTSTGIRGRVEEQQAMLYDRFKNFSKAVGDRVDTTGSPAADNIIGKALDIDKKIGLMYDYARMKTKGQRVVQPKFLLRELRKLAPKKKVSKGLITSIEDTLKQRKIIQDIDGIKTARPISVKEAENLVQEINSMYSKSNSVQNRIGRLLKNAIDDDVTKSGGSDLFRQARHMKAQFHRDLERTSRSKFSKRTKSLHRDVLEEKIQPHEVLEKGILSSSYWPEEIRDFKNYLTKVGTAEQRIAGKRAWEDLKSQGVEYMMERSFKGPTDQLGNQTITRYRFDQALRAFGKNKLKEIYSPQELEIIDDFKDVLRLIEPISMTQQGKGPSAQAVAQLEKAMGRYEKIKRAAANFDSLKALMDLRYSGEDFMLKGKPTGRAKETGIKTAVARTAAPLAAGAAAAKATEE